MKKNTAYGLLRLPSVALLLACGCAGLAAAAPSSADVPSVVVRYGDLNLQTEAGVRTLYRRLARAAAQVCPVPLSNLDLTQLGSARSCQAAAIARATASLHDPRLVEVIRARFKTG